jgi:hypothetical protein
MRVLLWWWCCWFVALHRTSFGSVLGMRSARAWQPSKWPGDLEADPRNKSKSGEHEKLQFDKDLIRNYPFDTNIRWKPKSPGTKQYPGSSMLKGSRVAPSHIRSFLGNPGLLELASMRRPTHGVEAITTWHHLLSPAFEAASADVKPWKRGSSMDRSHGWLARDVYPLLLPSVFLFLGDTVNVHMCRIAKSANGNFEKNEGEWCSEYIFCERLQISYEKLRTCHFLRQGER